MAEEKKGSEVGIDELIRYYESMLEHRHCFKLSTMCIYENTLKVLKKVKEEHD